eukprot:CAMPEP_0185623040 /NCGR_PEP_ID=MMETSP0436-20130131/59604_1 /TAXON_ID=626734 ORGANISM="Favella taraikaensis, Strain Fe Narragansett Bay" /NCGR_SAMPLE_ID=MMETSP0436 /ASSEMBLY_ACC=CAM_ASM_000390 /LENGTH=136 /DNA_ID=CAMNT_0028264933 /DNA_START=48 /DNA_END=459 /DNA_ORIENTATION=+
MLDVDAPEEPDDGSPKDGLSHEGVDAHLLQLVMGYFAQVDLRGCHQADEGPCFRWQAAPLAKAADLQAVSMPSISASSSSSRTRSIVRASGRTRLCSRLSKSLLRLTEMASTPTSRSIVVMAVLLNMLWVATSTLT